MNQFCSECGHKIESEQVFCPECGAPQQIAKVEEKKFQPQPVIPPPPRKPMSFKKKLSYTLIALLVVGLIGGHQMIKANTSPQQKVDAFLQALYTGDIEGAKAEIIIPENVGKDDQAFYEFLAEQDLDDFKYRMYEAASSVVEDGITRIVSHEDGPELFRVKESKFIGMYTGIQIEAMPVDVLLVSDFTGGKFTLGDKTVDTKNGEVEMGAFLPSRYNCPVTLENGVIEKSVELQCRIWGPDDVMLNVSIMGMAAEIWSNHEDAIIYIDGESSEKTVKEMKFVGLIKEGETFDLFAERKNDKGELEQSEVVTVRGGDFVELPIFSSDGSGEAALNSKDDEKEEEIEEEVEEVEEVESETAKFFDEETLTTFIWNFRAAYEKSLNNKDFSYIDHYLEEGSIARNELIEFIGDIGDDYYLYNFFADEVVAIEILGKKAFVTTYEEFDFTNHLGVETNYKRSKKYEVHSNGTNGFQIAKIDILDTVRDN